MSSPLYRLSFYVPSALTSRPTPVSFCLVILLERYQQFLAASQTASGAATSSSTAYCSPRLGRWRSHSPTHYGLSLRWSWCWALSRASFWSPHLRWYETSPRALDEHWRWASGQSVPWVAVSWRPLQPKTLYPYTAPGSPNMSLQA